MTKEQEKAIKVLEQYKQECIDEYKVELDDKKNTDEQHASYLRQQIEAVYTVFNMLKDLQKENKILMQTNKSYKGIINKKDTEIKEKDKEIDEVKQALARNIAKNVISNINKSAKSKEDLEMLNAGWQIEIKKKDKIIDLMAETIRKLAFSLANYKGSYNKETINFTENIKGIKQYFERKVKDD